MANTSLPFSNSTNKICSVVGCSKDARHAGMCSQHYRSSRRKTPCSILDCKQMACTSRGLCDKHEWRLRKNGDPLVVQKVSTHGTVAERFWAKVDKDGPEHPYDLSLGKCWLWTGSRGPKGYGKMYVGSFNKRKKTVGAHKVAFFVATGAMPQKYVLHSCDNPPCVNPDHLREGTQRENMDDRNDRNRTAKGGQIPNSKIEPMIVAIKQRLKNGESPTVIAKEVGADPATINNIRRGRTWKHVQI